MTPPPPKLPKMRKPKAFALPKGGPMPMKQIGNLLKRMKAK